MNFEGRVYRIYWWIGCRAWDKELSQSDWKVFSLNNSKDAQLTQERLEDVGLGVEGRHLVLDTLSWSQIEMLNK